MTNCIFCKIINGDIPAHKVYEDTDVLAFIDLSQTTKGHTLLIPKKHVTDLFEYDEELASTTFAKVPKIARALEKALPDMKGLNVVNNNREVASQTVFHSHIHLIPRYGKTDGFKFHYENNSDKYTQADLANLAQKISEQV